jgi:hypothetical protein
MIGLALLFLAAQHPDLARAESLLAAGKASEAARVAERGVARRPDDAAARMLLGRAHFARPVVGRYAALAAFRTAARLAPREPQPLYWQMRVGFHLGSDEGDRIAREAILAILALDPDYEDCWDRLRELYGGPDVWRRADRALAVHGAAPMALERRAELAIALEAPQRAESLLAQAAEGRPPGVYAYALRAEASFVAGRDSAGHAWYDSALAIAGSDSTGVLWDQAWLIASPEESARYAATSTADQRAFFDAFWGRREPNLLTRENERIAEHYRRRAEARRRYRLLHPQRMVYRSETARALAAVSAQEELAAIARRSPEVIPGGGGEAAAAASQVALLALPLRDLQDSALRLAFRARLGAQGLVYVRYGEPDVRGTCAPDPLRPLAPPDCVGPTDAEGWLYWTADGPLSIGFAGAAGEYFRPVSRHQVEAARLLLRTDRTTTPAPLAARAWSAFFRSALAGRTDVYTRATSGNTAVALWDDEGNEAARAAGSGVLTLTVFPGDYASGLDVDSAGVLGRLRGPLRVPAFEAGFAISSLALATSDTVLNRGTALASMPASLEYPVGSPLSAYAEVYGLTADSVGRARYHVRYSFERVRGALGRWFTGGPTVLEFEREVLAAPTVAEGIVIEPGRLPAGRYRVTLAVTDLLRNVKSEAAAIHIQLR